MSDAADFAAIDRAIGLSEAWRHGGRGLGVTVALLDTGVAASPVLGEAVAERRDMIGDGGAEPGAPHGTRMAETLHAVAPEAAIVSFKVFPEPGAALSLRPNAKVRKAVAAALDACVAAWPRIRVVNLSLSVRRGPLFRCRPDSPCVMCAAVNRAAEAGLLVVAAAGNDGPSPDTIECPGQAPGALTVGATLSRASAERLEREGDPEGRYGTSYSAAIVSGGAALLLGACPEATAAEVRAALVGSARPLPGAAPNAQGAGQIQLGRALGLLLGPPPAAVANACSGLSFNAGNAAAQRPDNLYLTGLADTVLEHVEKGLLRRGESAAAARLLEDLHGWLLPGGMPAQEARLAALRRRCG